MKTQRTLLALTLWLTACVPTTTTAYPPPTNSVPTQGYPGPATLTPAPTAVPTTPVPPTETPAATATPKTTLPFPEAQLISSENVGSLEQLAQFRQGNELYDIAWSSNNRTIAFIIGVGLFILDLKTGEERTITDAITSDPRTEIAFSPDGDLLAQSIAGEETRLFNTQTGELVRAFVDDGAESVAFAPEGGTLVATSGSSLKLWDIESGQLIRVFTVPNSSGKFRQTAFAPNGEFVAASTTGGGLFVWDVNSGALRFQTTVNFFLARQLVFSPDSETLAIGDSETPGLQIWSVSSTQMTFGVSTHAFVNGISFTHDGSVIASAGGAPNVIEFWSVENKVRIAQIELANHEFDLDFVEDIAFSPDGRLFASAGGSGSGIIIWGVVRP